VRVEVGMLDVWAGGEKEDGLEEGVGEEHEVSFRRGLEKKREGVLY